MKVNKLGEFGLIERIRSKLTTHNPQLATRFLGIGDDTAVIKISPQKYFLWTTDILIEGTHFFKPSFVVRRSSFVRCTMHDARRTFPFMLGWKSLAVNLSDVAAMGGIPKYALVTLGLTGKEDVKFIDDLYRGMITVGRGLSHPPRAEGLSHPVQILGGDTSKSPVLIIDVSVIGEVEKKNLILRKGARPGDIICVTGFCGDSAAGFELLKCRGRIYPTRSAGSMNRTPVIARSDSDVAISLVKKHLMPTPRLKESQVIAKNHLATSMIDNSDGLLLSVKFICQPSGVGAKIYEEKIPISQQLRYFFAMSFPRKRESNICSGAIHRTTSFALTGGEDYELVFTVPPKKLKYALKIIPKLTGTPVTAIGEITKNKGIFVCNSSGKRKNIKNMGFDHFV